METFKHYKLAHEIKLMMLNRILNISIYRGKKNYASHTSTFKHEFTNGNITCIGRYTREKTPDIHACAGT